MIKFKKINENNLKQIQKHTKESEYLVCDLSAGVIYMWDKVYNPEYAVFNQTLIIKCNFKNKETAFFMPVGKDVEGGLLEIENYAVKNSIPLNYLCVEESGVELLNKRYNGEIEASYNRNWSDYLYDYTELLTLTGKKFSGQRNHINNFKKNYKDYKFKKLQPKDIPRVLEFLKEYKKEHNSNGKIEREEFKNTLKLVKNLNLAKYYGGYMEIDKKLCSFTIAEKVGKTFVIHVEKALRGYKGIYPTTFNEFLKQNQNEGFIYINREDDSGDLGLRTSKLQYQPIKLINKHYVEVKKPMQIKKPPKLVGKKVVLSKILESDKQDYFKLYTNQTLNKHWGYDYKKDVKNPTEDAFYDMQFNDFKRKDNLCLKIAKKNDTKMIGEVVLHNFTYQNTIEVGVRLFKKEQGKGYAKESVILACNYIINKLKKAPVAKCYIKNTLSLQMLMKAGFEISTKDKKYYHLKYKIGDFIEKNKF